MYDTISTRVHLATDHSTQYRYLIVALDGERGNFPNGEEGERA